MAAYLLGTFAWLIILGGLTVHVLRKAPPASARAQFRQERLTKTDTVPRDEPSVADDDIDPRIAEIIEAIPRRRVRRPA